MGGADSWSVNNPQLNLSFSFWGNKIYKQNGHVILKLNKRGNVRSS